MRKYYITYIDYDGNTKKSSYLKDKHGNVLEFSSRKKLEDYISNQIKNRGRSKTSKIT